ncbi:MAG TPA: hypothetical protein VJO53_05365 [Candidatus Acidoferrales bacterium]|nr:hypothetical protein [Candidatus Acidoferrales bacterium]
MKSPSRSFARILGRSPVIRAEKYRCLDHPSLLSETFGPPELLARKRSVLVFWNFTREDGAGGFTLFARLRPKSKPREIEVRLAANSGVKSFVEWAIDRLSAHDGGEEAPLFIGSGAFAITRIE